MTPIKQAAALAAGALLLSQPAVAASAMTAQQFVDARLAAFGTGNLDAMMAQYSQDAVIFTSSGVVRGHAEIRAMLEQVLADFGQQGTTFELRNAVAEGNTVAFVWSAETPTTHYELGVETYVLAEGMAVYQTLVVTAGAR